MIITLRAAAIYNAVWGAWVVLFPLQLFQWTGLPVPVYPQIWQCVGMIVGVYAVGYWVASRNPFRHWPIVLVGLLGKVLGPFGFAWAWIEGTLPSQFGLTILSNDLVWWIPFTFILLRAWSHHRPQLPTPGTTSWKPS